MLYEINFLISLFLTLIIEIPILFVLVKYAFKENIENSKILFIGFLASFSTLPYLWFVFQPLINTLQYIYIGEIFVLLVEAVVYNQLLDIKIQRALLISFIANLVSFGFGLFVF